MPRTFAEVYDLYRDTQDSLPPSMDLRKFSTFANDITGTQDFNAGQRSWLPQLAQKGSYWVDKGLEATGAPQAFGDFGEAAATSFGVDPQLGRDVMGQVPRGFVDFASLFVPGLGEANAAARLAIAGGMSAANAFEKTDSGLHAAAAAVTPFAMQKAVGVVGDVLAKTPFVRAIEQPTVILDLTGTPTGSMVSQHLVEGLADKSINYAVQQAAASGTGELINYATDAIDQKTWNPYEGRSVKDWLFSTVGGNLPWMVHDIPSLLRKQMPIGTPKVKLRETLEEAKKAPELDASITEQEALMRMNETDRQIAMLKAAQIEDPAQRVLAESEAKNFHDYRARVMKGELPSKAFTAWDGDFAPIAKANDERQAVYDAVYNAHEQLDENARTLAALKAKEQADGGSAKARATAYEAVRKLTPVDPNDITTLQQAARVAAEAEHLATLNGHDPSSAKAARETTTATNIELGVEPVEATKQAIAGERNLQLERAKRKADKAAARDAEDSALMEWFDKQSRDAERKAETDIVARALTSYEPRAGDRERTPVAMLRAYRKWAQRQTGPATPEELARLGAALNTTKTRAGGDLAGPPVQEGGKSMTFVDKNAAMQKATELEKRFEKIEGFVGLVPRVENGKTVLRPYFNSKEAQQHYWSIEESNGRAKKRPEQVELSDEGKSNVEEATKVLTKKPTSSEEKSALQLARDHVHDLLVQNQELLGFDDARVGQFRTALDSFDTAQVERTLTMLQDKIEIAESMSQEDEPLKPAFQRVNADRAGLLFGAPNRTTTQALGERVGNPLLPTVSNAIRETLIRSGFGEREVGLFQPFLQKVIDRFNVEGLKAGVIINDNARMNSRGEGLAGLADPREKMFWLAANREGVGSLTKVKELSVVTAHEMAHIVEKAAREGYAGRDVQDTFNKVRTWAMQDTEKAWEFLDIWRQSLHKDWRDLPQWEALLQQKGRDPDEFMANVGALWSVSDMQHEFAGSMLAVMPQPIRTWAKAISNYSRRVLSALKSAMFIREGELSMPVFRDTVRAMTEMFDTATQKINWQEHQMELLKDVVSLGGQNSFWLQTANLRYNRKNEEYGLYAREPKALKAARKTAASDREMGGLEEAAMSALRTTQGLVSQVPVFGRAGHALFRHTPMIKKFYNKAIASLWGGINPDTNTLNMKGRQAELARAGKREVNEKLSKLMSDAAQWWQNSGREDKVLDAKTLMDENPSWPPGEKGARKLGDHYRILNDFEKEAFQHHFNGWSLQYRELGNQFVASHEDAGRSLMSTVLGKALPSERWKSAPELVEKLTLGLDKALSDDPATKLYGAQLMETARRQIANDDTYNALTEMWLDVKQDSSQANEYFASKPGHLSMIRRGKYIARAYNVKGEKYTDALNDISDYSKWEANMRTRGYNRFDKPEMVQQKENIRIDSGLLDLASRIETKRRDQISKLPLNDETKQFILQHLDMTTEVARMMAAKDLRIPGSLKGLEGTERQKVPGSMDMVAGQELFASIASRLSANKILNARLAYELTNPELANYQQDVSLFKRHVANYMRPDSAFARSISSFNAKWFLSGNIPAIISNIGQTPMTVYPELINQGMNPIKAAWHTIKAMKFMAGFTADKVKGWATGDHEAIKNIKDDKERMFMKYMVDEGMFAFGALHESVDINADASLDINHIGERGKIMKPFDKAMSVGSRAINQMMKVYAASETFNKEAAAIMGFRLAREKQGANFDFKTAAEFAIDFMHNTTYSAGRANRPVAQGDLGAVGAMAYSLQSYTLGYMNQIARYMMHWKGSEYLNLTPQQRQSAGKAALSMLGVQVAASGLMGMPLAGAFLKILENLTGEDYKGKAYELMAKLLDDDEREGSPLATMVMDGSANSMLAAVGMPVDLGSKWAVNGVLGLNSYDGFNGDMVFGPMEGIAASALTGLKSAREGNVAGAFTSITPPALKRAMNLWTGEGEAKVGQSSVPLDSFEQTAYAVGFNPQKVSALQKYKSIEHVSSEEDIMDNRRQTAKILAALNEDSASAKQMIDDAVTESGGLDKRQDVVKRVASLAADKAFPDDIRENVTKKSAAHLMEVARILGVSVPEARQVAKSQYRQNIMRLLGGRPGQMSDRARQADRVGASYTPFSTLR